MHGKQTFNQIKCECECMRGILWTEMLDMWDSPSNKRRFLWYL